jgi:hypothetical protein
VFEEKKKTYKITEKDKQRHTYTDTSVVTDTQTPSSDVILDLGSSWRRTSFRDLSRYIDTK